MAGTTQRRDRRGPRRSAGGARRPSRPTPCAAPLQLRGGGGVTAAPRGRCSKAGDPSVTLGVWAWGRARGALRHPLGSAARWACGGCGAAGTPFPSLCAGRCLRSPPRSRGARGRDASIPLSLSLSLPLSFFLIICIMMIFADFLIFFSPPPAGRRGGRSVAGGRGAGGSRARARRGAGRRAELPSCPF